MGRHPFRRERAKPFDVKPLRFREARLVRVLPTKDERGRREERDFFSTLRGGRAQEVRTPKRARGLGPN
jgi:hypothetical protein